LFSYAFAYTKYLYAFWYIDRHFIQTADVAGVGISLMRKIFDDISANAEKRAEVVICRCRATFRAACRVRQIGDNQALDTPGRDTLIKLKRRPDRSSGLADRTSHIRGAANTGSSR
jgi:hypothetical protein